MSFLVTALSHSPNAPEHPLSARAELGPGVPEQWRRQWEHLPCFWLCRPLIPLTLFQASKPPTPADWESLGFPLLEMGKKGHMVQGKLEADGPMLGLTSLLYLLGDIGQLTLPLWALVCEIGEKYPKGLTDWTRAGRPYMSAKRIN